MGWLRNFMRKKTSPIPQNVASKWKFYLSSLYCFAAWNAFIMIFIYSIKKLKPETEEEKANPSQYYAKLLRTGEARVIHYDGLTKVGEYTIEAKSKNVPKRPHTAGEFVAEKIDDGELLKDELLTEEYEKTNREDLNLLVEESDSL